MTRLTNAILVAVAGLAGLAILVAGAAAAYLGVNSKARVEAAASEALDMEVTVLGRATVGFFPGFNYVLEDVHVRNGTAEVASAGEAELRIALLPLLLGRVRVDNIALGHLRLVIERDRQGRLNVDNAAASPRTRPGLAIAHVSVADAMLVYADEQTGKRFEMSDCQLNVDDLKFPPKGSPDSRQSLSFAASLACGQVQTRDFSGSDLRLAVDAMGGMLDFDPVTMRLLGGFGSGSVHADYSGSTPVYHVSGRLTQFRMEEFFKALSSTKVGSGLMDLTADLTLSGPLTGALVGTAAGDAALRGANLRLEIGDLDEQFARHESSQNFNLVDVAAVFFAGPLGLGITKGYNFARIFQDTKGGTLVPTLVSVWHVQHGVAHAKDVAMSTPKNRVALTGNLDFVTGRFDEVTVALVDASGCAKVKQKVRGPFLEPQVEPPSVLTELTGPSRRLLAQVEGLFGAKCEVFYAGSVPPPTQR